MVVPVSTSRGKIFSNHPQISHWLFPFFTIVSSNFSEGVADFSLFFVFVLVLVDGADEFYAVNNEFLVTGPKGSFEFTMVENEDMFIRLDLPGVPNDGVRVTIVPTTRKEVTISAHAPKENKHDSSPRIYGCTTGLVCKCCEISTFTFDMCDGVLRLLLSKRKSTSNLSSTICNFFCLSIFIKYCVI